MLRILILPCLCGHGLNFISIGDWGDTMAKTYVATIMGEYASSYSAEFVLGIGDNMYDTGVSSVDDPQFSAKFEETFEAESLEVPWYIVGGNHDYYGNIDAQVEYSQRSERWTFPELYYTEEIAGQDGVTVTIVALDTWRINGGDTYVQYDAESRTGVIRDVGLLTQHWQQGVVTNGTYDSITRTFPARELAPDFQASTGATADDEQLEQLDWWLGNSTADWKIVMGHFPVYSCTAAEHGDTTSLVNSLAPILSKHGVNAYFSGHDHILQHIVKDGVNFFGSGAGARTHSSVNADYAGLMGHAAGHYGFMVHELSTTEMKTTFVVNDNGLAAEPYSFVDTKARD